MKLRTFNNLLSAVVIILGLYIALSPFLPQLAFLFRDTSPAAVAPYAGALAENQGNDSGAPAPEDNRIVIPSIGVNEPILEGDNIWVINHGGTWRRPNTAEPLENNNTVIVGHRFYGDNVSTFYHLDKVVEGQQLALYWEGEEVLYEVIEQKIVDSTEVDIEAETNDRRLTIYTCDPIWTAKNRLVIIAKPIDQGGDTI